MCICLITPGISGNYSPISEISAEIDRYPGTRPGRYRDGTFHQIPVPAKTLILPGFWPGFKIQFDQDYGKTFVDFFSKFVR